MAAQHGVATTGLDTEPDAQRRSQSVEWVGVLDRVPPERLDDAMDMAPPSADVLHQTVYS